MSKRSKEELKLQEDFCKWYLSNRQRRFDIISGTPGFAKQTLGINKRLHYLSGMPDLALFEAHVEYKKINDSWCRRIIYGFFIEFKAPKYKKNPRSRLSEAQEKVHNNLRQLGYKVLVTGSFKQAKREMLNFKNLPLLNGDFIECESKHDLEGLPVSDGTEVQLLPKGREMEPEATKKKDKRKKDILKGRRKKRKKQGPARPASRTKKKSSTSRRTKKAPLGGRKK